MAEACHSVYNHSSTYSNESFCPVFFDRIACWPPTQPGFYRRILCPANVFPRTDNNSFALRFCNHDGKWEERAHYEFCIGCFEHDRDNSTELLSLPDTYVSIRRYFVIVANCLSIVLLALGILILLTNSRLRQYSRNILHVNMFFVFLLRSIIQLIIELWMSNGYFAHNVFERIDACNRTTVYFQEGDLLDCKLFIIFMNYINSSAAHWFVSCEAVYLFLLLQGATRKGRVRWYIVTGWCVPFVLTFTTYGIRYIKKQDIHSCWFEPSSYDWILHGPNIVLQIVNFVIFNYICVLLARKLNKDYRCSIYLDQRRFSRYSRLARSTLILLPMFSIHYFFFLWNTKPFLIPQLILIHLTVQTIFSSLQGFMVALIYTLINGEVQREIFLSLNRWLLRNEVSCRSARSFRNYMNSIDNERFEWCPYRTRNSLQETVCTGRQENSCQNYQRINQSGNLVDNDQILMSEISTRQ